MTSQSIADGRLVVPCLPGWRTSVAILEKQLKITGWWSLLEDIVELLPIQPPHPATGPVHPTIPKLQVPGPYYEWLTFADPTGPEPGHDQVEEAKYTNQTETLKYLERELNEIVKKKGRIDGLLGFSQGTAVAVIAMAAVMNGVISCSQMPRFLVLVGGFESFNAEARDWLSKTGRLRLPSLHVIGTADSLLDFAMNLAHKYFEHPVVVTHNRGHIFPRVNREELKLVRMAVRDFFERMGRQDYALSQRSDSQKSSDSIPIMTTTTAAPASPDMCLSPPAGRSTTTESMPAER